MPPQSPSCETQLAGRYEAVFKEPCRSRNKQYLLRRIAWRLQANDEGGLSPAALERAARLAAGADVRLTAPRTEAAAPVTKSEPRTFKYWDPRLPPPKTLLEREYKGRTFHVVTRGAKPKRGGGTAASTCVRIMSKRHSN